ncbi:MAG: hypothetical protein ACUVUQ_07155 [Thermodesulfovibrionales bacterium]
MILIITLILISFLNLQFVIAQIHTKDVTLKSKVETTQKNRDPFSLPPGIQLLTKEGERVESVEGNHTAEGGLVQKVKAILISKHLKLALIDHHIVGVGDSIRDEKVIDIRPDHVILSKGDKKRMLILYKSNIPLKIERN